MLNLLTRLRGLAAPERKRSRTGPLIAWQATGRPVWTPRDYAGLAREGYLSNAVVHRCVRLVSETAAQAQLSVRVDGREDESHPLAALMRRPNPRQAWSQLM